MSSNTKAGGKDVKETTASVKLNQMTGGMAPAQGNSVLLEAGGGDGAGGKGGEGSEEDEEKKRAKPALGAKKASKSSGPDAESANCVSDPVDVVSGAVVDEALDFVLPGVIPIEWKRSYSSARHEDTRSLGRGGWCHPYDQWIEGDVGDEGEPLLCLRDGDGRSHYFEPIGRGSSSYHRAERLTLSNHASGHFEVYDHESRLTRVFSRSAAGSDRAWLREIRDAYGSSVQMTYEGEHLSRIDDTAGRQVRLLRDRLERIIRIEIWASPPTPPLSPGGSSVAPEALALVQWLECAYHETDELSRVTNALGESDRYEYDGHHRRVRSILKNGVSFYYRYESDSAFCIKAWGDGDLHAVDLEPHPVEKSTLTGGTTEPRRYVYNDLGLVVEERTHDDSFVLLREFDADGLLLSETNAAGETVLHEYDEAGRRTRTVDPAGNETIRTYDGDLLVERLDPGGLTTQYRYDRHGALDGITFANGQSFVLVRDPYGRVTGIDGPDGPFIRCAYDSHHNLARRVDARGGKTVYAYDSLGRARLRVDALGRHLQMAYDVLGQPLQVTYPDGTQAQLAYDALGNITRIVDSVGQTTELEYGGTGVLARLVQPDGQSWRFEYDHDEKLIGVINPRGETYRYDYDFAGRIEREQAFDGRVTEYRYGKSDRVSRVDYADETWRELAYDPLGNLIEDRSPHGDIILERDSLGRLVRALVKEYNGIVENVFQRDALGRIVSETQQGRTIAFAYDERARRAVRTLPNGEVTKYGYDSAGDLISVHHHGVLVRIERNALGQELGRSLGTTGVKLTSAYDALDRLVEQKVTAPEPRGASVRRAVVDRTFRYDPLGRVTQIADERWGAQAYHYDSIGQLVESMLGGRSEVFVYDAVGSLVGALRALEPTQGDERWRTLPGNILVEAGDLRFENDVRARRTAMIAPAPSTNGEGREQRTEYHWDCRDRLREVRLPDGRRVLYTYDAFSRRVRKEVIPAARADYVALVELLLEKGAGAAPSVEVTEYLWDGDVLAADIGAVQASSGDDRSVQVDDRGAAVDIDRPRAPGEQADVRQQGQRGPPTGWRVFVHEPRTFVPMLQSEGGRVYFYINDHLGMPRELIDSKGRIAWAARHDAWGVVTEIGRPDGIAGISTPFRMLGQYADDDVGLCYTRFRWFDARLGRWCSPDPLGLAGGKNLLGFNAAPTSDVDPEGLACKHSVYVLRDKDGNIVYVGITDRNPRDRMLEHRRDGKAFHHMEVVAADLTSRRAARDIEGSALHHMQGQGLQNRERLDGGYYHSYRDPPGGDRTLLTQSEVTDVFDNGIYSVVP